MPAAPPIRVALVGCGHVAHVHCGYLQHVPQAALVGACGVSRENREHLTARWQVPTYSDVDALLRAARPDVVHVVTPPASHAALVIQLLDAGVHVLVEKPMALTVADAAAMVAAAHRAGRYLTVNHNRLFDPVVERAGELLDSGRLGSLIGIDVFQAASAVEAERSTVQGSHWKTSLPGGYLFNVAPHPTYLLQRFAGAIQNVHVVARTGSGRLQELRAVAQGARALGSLTISLETRPSTRQLTLFGSAMTAQVNLNNMTMILRPERHVRKLVGKVLPNLDEAAQLVRATVVNGIKFIRGHQRFYPGVGIHFRRLYQALALGQPPPVSAEDGLECARLVERMWTQAGVAANSRVGL